jgi:hypothetical protein
MKKPSYLEVVLSVCLIGFITLHYNLDRKHQHQERAQTEQINNLKERVQQDSIHIEMIEYNYDVVMEENQIFGSLLAEKEVKSND